MIPKLAKVLMVTDFTADAGHSLPFAYAIAEPGGEVVLMHVIEHQDNPNPLYAHYSEDDLSNPQRRQKAIAEVEERLRGMIPKGSQEKSVTTTVAAVVHPAVVDGILQEARERKADAIVIGSHGGSGLAQLLMGSVAEAVTRHSEVPVLIVPHKG